MEKLKAADFLNQIETLRRLRAQEVLTEAEFGSRKAGLLQALRDRGIEGDAEGFMVTLLPLLGDGGLTPDEMQAIKSNLMPSAAPATTSAPLSSTSQPSHAWWRETNGASRQPAATGRRGPAANRSIVPKAIFGGLGLVALIYFGIQEMSERDDQVRAERAAAVAAAETAKHPPYSVQCENGSTPAGTPGHEEWCQKSLPDGGRVRDGEYRAWNAQAEDVAEGHYVAGLQDGLWTTVAKEEPDGLVKTLSPYKRGRLDGVVHRLQAGDELSDGEYKNGVLIRTDTWSGAGSERVIVTCMYPRKGKAKCRKEPDPERGSADAQAHPYGTPSAQRNADCEAKYRPAIEACSVDKPGCDDRCHYLCASINETYLKACKEGRSD